MRKTKRHGCKSASSEKKNVGEVKEITLRELKDLADKAREGNLHKKVRMPAYNILIQHIHNAKEYDSRYKNILEEKKRLCHLSEDTLFSELRSCIGDIPVETENKKKFQSLLLMVDVYEEARNLCKAYREEQIPFADIDIDDETIDDSDAMSFDENLTLEKYKTILEKMNSMSNIGAIDVQQDLGDLSNDIEKVIIATEKLQQEVKVAVEKDELTSASLKVFKKLKRSILHQPLNLGEELSIVDRKIKLNSWYVEVESILKKFTNTLPPTSSLSSTEKPDDVTISVLNDICERAKNMSTDILTSGFDKQLAIIKSKLELGKAIKSKIDLLSQKTSLPTLKEVERYLLEIDNIPIVISGRQHLEEKLKDSKKWNARAMLELEEKHTFDEDALRALDDQRSSIFGSKLKDDVQVRHIRFQWIKNTREILYSKQPMDNAKSNLIRQAIKNLNDLPELVLCYSGDRSMESTVNSIVRDCTDIMVKYDYAKKFLRRIAPDYAAYLICEDD